MSDLPKIFKIKKIRKDAPNINTYILDGGYNSLPGQFVMLWLPGVDEKPISVAYQNDKETHLTIAAIGHFTNAMAELKEGDRIGMRGPFGAKWSLDKGNRYCLVGGGVGVPPLFNAAVALRKENKEVDFIIGARSKDYVIFEKQLKEIGVNVYVCTDDGSYGFHGFTTQKLEELLKKGEKYDMIQTCGPEIMMVKIAKIAEEFDIPSEVSVERYMKCGFGICGQCAVDGDGKCMCIEGPIIEGKLALSWEEFGKYHRDGTGRKC